MEVTSAPSKAPRAPAKMEYARDVLGKRVPAQTALSGNSGNDAATGYEASVIR
jgi:hypothetical protein